MNRLHQKCLVCAAGVLIAALALFTALLPKKEFSENENRYLASFPELSAESVRNAEFMSGIETYVSDHFVLRDLFMTVRTCYERITGRNQVNGVYICEDGYCIEEYRESKNRERIKKAVLRLCEGVESADIRICLVPTAVSVYSDRLPSASRNADQLRDMKEMIDEIKTGLMNTTGKESGSGANEDASDNNGSGNGSAGGRIQFTDVTDTLKAHADENIFYRLDHHWTTLGAYYAYVELCSDLGIEPYKRSDYEERTVSTTFKGSFYSKINDLTMKPDTITAFESNRMDLTVRYPDKKLETDTLTAEEYLNKKDQYSYFLNNQNSFIEIHNKNADTDRVLAVVKDSYANCLVPFLAEHFETVYVFDTRYYRDRVTAFINGNGVTDVLFLYNMYTIDTDTGIAGIY